MLETRCEMYSYIRIVSGCDLPLTSLNPKKKNGNHAHPVRMYLERQFGCVDDTKRLGSKCYSYMRLNPGTGQKQ